MLEPDVHYLPVRADGADVAAVVERLADRELVEATATRAYADLVLSGRYGYAALAAQLERVLDEERPAAGAARPGALRRAQAAAAAYNAAVVRPPRWAYKAVDRVAPGVDPAPGARAGALVPPRAAGACPDRHARGCSVAA